MNEITYYGQSHAQDLLDMLFDMEVHPELYHKHQIIMPRGICLIGAPGMGKTLFAHKAAQLLKKKLLIIRPSGEMLSKEIEETFERARLEGDVIVLLDEVFNMIYKDEKTEGQLLSELDSNNRFLVIATTSASQYEIESHEALMRPGRFDIKLHLAWPSHEDRRIFFADQLKHQNLTLDPDVLTSITAGESFAFLHSYLNRLKMVAVKRRQTVDHALAYEVKELMTSFEHERRTINDQSLMDVAIHEIGHAVYGIMAKRTVSLIELSKNQFRGKTTFEPSFETDVSDLKIQMAISLSGYAAGASLTKRHTSGAELDFEDTRNLFSMMIRNTMIIKKRTAVTFVQNGNAEQLEAYYQRQYRRLMRKTFRHTRLVLFSFKHVIQMYATELIQKGILTKEDLSKLEKEITDHPCYPMALRKISRFKR